MDEFVMSKLRYFIHKNRTVMFLSFPISLALTIMSVKMFYWQVDCASLNLKGAVAYGAPFPYALDSEQVPYSQRDFNEISLLIFSVDTAIFYFLTSKLMWIIIKNTSEFHERAPKILKIAAKSIFIFVFIFALVILLAIAIIIVMSTGVEDSIFGGPGLISGMFLFSPRLVPESCF